MQWIKVAATIGGDPSIGSIAQACRVHTAEAVGLVVLALTHFGDHASDGNVSTVPDKTLEEWAKWEGKRGTFAAAFRANLCDDNGIVSAWEKHNGAALREAKAARERMKAARVLRTFGEQEANGSGVVRSTFPSNGTETVVTTPTTTTAGAHFARFEDDAACEAYMHIRRAHADPAAFDHAVLQLAEPLGGNGFGFEVVGKALFEMRANGANWNLGLARGYCARIANPPPERRPRADASAEPALTPGQRFLRDTATDSHEDAA